jgi:chlorite dismutase
VEDRFYSFIGTAGGQWRVTSVAGVVGESLEPTEGLDVQNTYIQETPPAARWVLRGVTSNQRYVTRPEQTALAAVQEAIGRPGATCAAMIPMSKSVEWWALTQDERREIFESRSAHIATGLRYLPAVARRLHHGRDLGEPFDFITWFEFAPSQAAAFEELVGALRRSEEWKYVVREVDIRLVRAEVS